MDVDLYNELQEEIMLRVNQITNTFKEYVPNDLKIARVKDRAKDILELIGEDDGTERTGK